MRFFFFFSCFPERLSPQTFLLKGDSGDTVVASNGAALARGERHPQRTRLGTPVRGGDTKKGGRGGKGTWGATGSETDSSMRNGALDRRDPNYSSGSSDDDEQLRPVARAASAAPAPAATPAAATQGGSAPTQATVFKRIPVEQLFQSAAAAPSPPSSSSGLPTPVASAVAAGGGGGDMRKAEQYAGGAHHNIPEASKVPLPASLGSTPTKQSRAAGLQQQQQQQANGSPDAARIEQALKALLRLNS